MPFREAKRRRNLRRRLHKDAAPIHSAKPSKIAMRPAAARNDAQGIMEMSI